MARKSQDPKWAKRWRLDYVRGLRRLTPADEARDRVAELLAQGASLRSIADVAGLSVTCVHGIHLGQRTVKKPTAAALTRIRYADLFLRDNPEGFVPKVGAVRRIRALQVLGHNATTIGAAGGVNAQRVHNTVNQRGDWISRRNHDAIVRAYDALWDVPGTSARVAGRARKAGWPGPLAWDDDTIDDPLAQPDLGGRDDELDEIAIQRAIDGDPASLTDAEMIEVLTRLAGQGLSDAGIAARLKVSSRTVLRWRQRHDIANTWAA